MIAEIFTAGPNLADHIRGKSTVPEIGIAVNRAALVIPRAWYDWLSAGDPEIYDELPAPTCGFVAMTKDIAANITAKGGDWSRPLPRAWSDLRLLDKHPASFSMTAALALAAHLGAKSVTIYGHSAEGEADCVGRFGSDRSLHRWKRESKEIAAMIQLMQIPVLTITTPTHSEVSHG